MTETFLVGCCLILVVARLFAGDPGRPTIIAAIIVGAAISAVGDLANGGTDAATSLASVVEKIGSLGGVTTGALALAVVAFPVGRPFRTPDGRVNLSKTPMCACGKDGTPRAHGWIGDRTGFTCSEIRAMRNQLARVEQRRHLHRAAEGLRERARVRVVTLARRVLGEQRVNALVGEES